MLMTNSEKVCLQEEWRLALGDSTAEPLWRFDRLQVSSDSEEGICSIDIRSVCWFRPSLHASFMTAQL
jgi:hypothetical protein